MIRHCFTTLTGSIYLRIFQCLLRKYFNVLSIFFIRFSPNDVHWHSSSVIFKYTSSMECVFNVAFIPQLR